MPEDTVPTRIIVNGEEKIVDCAPRMTCFVHQQGIRLDVPEAVEINSRTTIDVMSKMSQKAWEHISTGQLFQHLFRKVFPPEDGDVPIPPTIEQLNKGDFGVIHIAGMIVQGCEAIFEGKTKLFFRNPEDNLHPKAEQRIMAMFLDMRNLAGAGDNVQVQELPPEKIEPEKTEEPKVKKPRKPRKKKGE